MDHDMDSITTTTATTTATATTTTNIADKQGYQLLTTTNKQGY